MAQLPALTIDPRNALLDLAPVQNALTGLQRQQNVNREYEQQQEQLGMQRESHALQKQNYERQWKQQEVENLGKRAQYVASLQGPQQISAWNSVLDKHGREGLTPEELDPNTGPQLMMAAAGLFRDPMDVRAKELGLKLTEAQIAELGRKADDPIKAYVADMLKNSGGASAPAPSAPSVQPQSNAGQTVPTTGILNISNPVQPPASGVQLVADTVPPVQTPAPQQQPQGDMVQVPGFPHPMTRKDALQRGGILMLDSRYSTLGKAMVEAAQGGGGAEQALGTAASTQNDKEELGATGALATLNTIKQTYDQKFLNIPNRLKLWGNNLASKFGGLPAKDQEELKAYSSFRQSAWHNLNRVLKDLSGTAVTENEMQRQLLDLPNPGKGVFDGDSPAEFEAKLKGALSFQHSAIARARWLRSKGFTGKPWEAGVAVEDMPNIINQRGAEIRQQLQQSNPNIDPMKLEQEIDRNIKQEFGI